MAGSLTSLASKLAGGRRRRSVRRRVSRKGKKSMKRVSRKGKKSARKTRRRRSKKGGQSSLGAANPGNFPTFR